MGAEKTLLTKCGEILIDFKRNKKTKVYLFNCAFCNKNCNQLKKFSLHLDENHALEFLSIPSPAINENAIKEESIEDIQYGTDVLLPELKVELIEIEAPVKDSTNAKNAHSRKSRNENEDPLDTIKRKMPMEQDILNRITQSDTDDDGGHEDSGYDLNSFEMYCEDSVDDLVSSDDSTQDATGKEYSSQDESKDRGCKSVKSRTHKNTNVSNNKRKQHINMDKNELIVTILKVFEKHPILWNIKTRSHDKIIRQNEFQSIADEVNENLRTQVKWIDIRRHIKDMRNEYSYEYEKKIRGEEHTMPWYTENMTFLKENIEALIKHRFKKRKYKRLKTFNDSDIPIFIEYYKSCEILWQVNNINYVVKTKKLEALKQILQDLKDKHNIDINLQDMQRRLDYLNRLYSDDKEHKLKCELDKIEFVPSSKYYEALSFLSESQGPFKCEQCNEIIHKYEKFHIHVSEHTNVAPFKCALCEVRFRKLPKYIVHAKRHLGLNKYHCDVCGKGYQFRSELEWHVREHTGEEPYLCEMCGASFRSQYSYDNHIRRHQKNFRYLCHICKHGFNHPHLLNAHVKAHLNIRDILCNVCGKGFTAMKHLRRHQQIHADTKRYKCSVCGKAFAQDAGLRAHRKQHAEYSPPGDVPKKPGIRKGKYNYT